jgi:hypothetical protein
MRNVARLCTETHYTCVRRFITVIAAVYDDYDYLINSIRYSRAAFMNSNLRPSFPA